MKTMIVRQISNKATTSLIKTMEGYKHIIKFKASNFKYCTCWFLKNIHIFSLSTEIYIMCKEYNYQYEGPKNGCFLVNSKKYSCNSCKTTGIMLGFKKNIT